MGAANPQTTTSAAWEQLEQLQNDLAHQLRRHDAGKIIDLEQVRQQAQGKLDQMKSLTSPTEKQEQDDPLTHVSDLASYLARPHTPLQWIIPGFLPEGTTVLMGESKGGKSILTTGIGWATATGGSVLNMYAAEHSLRTLYINLDESEDEFRDKLFGAVGGAEQMSQYDVKNIPFHVVHEWPTLPCGGLEALERWMERYPDTKIILIDCLMAFFQGVRGGKDIVQEDYHAVARLREFAARHHIALVLIAHTRKSKNKGEDVFTRINGTQGLLAAATSLMVLDRPNREEPLAQLHITGRRIPEKKLQLSLFTQSGCLFWQCDGNAKDLTLSQARSTLLEVLRDYPDISLEEVARYAEKNINTTRNLLTSLLDDGYVIRERVDNGRSGKYLFQLSVKGQEYLSQLEQHTEPLPRIQHTNPVVSIVSMVDSSNYGEYSTLPPVQEEPTQEDETLATSAPSQECEEPTIPTILTTPTMTTTQEREPTMLTTRREKTPSWLIPDTYEWKKLVERVGIQEAHQRRNAWMGQQKTK